MLHLSNAKVDCAFITSKILEGRFRSRRVKSSTTIMTRLARRVLNIGIAKSEAKLLLHSLCLSRI